MPSKLQKILCIDDDPDILMIVQVSLELYGGFTLLTCLGGQEGIAKAKTWQPDLIITDVMMPGLDGRGTLKQLRAERQTESIPVMFMTARVERSQEEEYRELGVACTIQKPFNPVTLAEQVRSGWARATGGH